MRLFPIRRLGDSILRTWRCSTASPAAGEDGTAHGMLQALRLLNAAEERFWL